MRGGHELTPPVDNNLIVNGDFTSGLYSWDIRLGGAPAPSIVPSIGGTNSPWVLRFDANGQWQGISQVFHTMPNSRISLSFKLRRYRPFINTNWTHHPWFEILLKDVEDTRSVFDWRTFDNTNWNNMGVGTGLMYDCCYLDNVSIRNGAIPNDGEWINVTTLPFPTISGNVELSTGTYSNPIEITDIRVELIEGTANANKIPINSEINICPQCVSLHKQN